MSHADWLGNRAQRHPNRIAVVDAASHRQQSFRGFDNRANQIAHFCHQWVGLLPGDCIGLLSTPSDDVLQIAVAASKLGMTGLLLDPAATPDTLITTINELGPRTLYHGLAQAALVQEIWFEVDSVEHIIPLRGAVDTANFEDIVAHYPPTPPSADREEEVPWLHFAAEGITWADLEAVAAHTSPDDQPDQVSFPIYRPDGLAAALLALQAGQGVVVDVDSVEVIKTVGEISPTEQPEAGYQRNVPTGRSWLPHEFM